MSLKSSPLALRAYLAPHRGTVLRLTLGLLVSTGLPLAGPQLMRRFVDQAIAGATLRSLVLIAGTYLTVMLMAQGVNVAVTYGVGRLAWRITNRLREDLAEHVLALDLAFHVHRTAGEMIERIDGDVTALGTFLSRFLLQVVSSILVLFGAVVLVWREDFRLGTALVAFLVVATVFIVQVQRRGVPVAAANREAQARLFGEIEERLAGLEDLRALGAGGHAIRKFHEATANRYRADLRWQVVSGAMFASTNVVFALGTALLLGLGVTLLERGTLTVGTVLLLFQYASLVRRPLESIAGQFKEFQEAAAGIGRVRELMAYAPTIVDGPDGGADLPDGPPDVRFDDVTFAYPDDPAVIERLSLTIGAGRSLGLVGRTGSGKTTIARLLLRLYDPAEGAVRVGGVDLRDIALSSLRQRVRIVTQDVQLFSADVRDNVTLFAGGVDDERLIEVLDDVGLERWRLSLPDGLDTQLGAHGVGLSAGEAQLLALARVFLADPAVVVLDEASSRLDPATDALIERAVDKLMAGRTAVIIAHRLSSLERVDDIAVIEAGQLVEHGPREQLAADPSSRFGRLLALSRGIPA